MVNEYPYVKNEQTGEYFISPICIAEIEFNTAIMEFEQKQGLHNFAVPEVANIFKNDNERRVTWLYFMNLKKRYVSMTVSKMDPFSSGKYHFNLEQTLFNNK